MGPPTNAQTWTDWGLTGLANGFILVVTLAIDCKMFFWILNIGIYVCPGPGICVTLAQALTSNHDTLSILDGVERHDISHFQSVVYLAVVNRVISRVAYQTELELGAVG